MDYNLLEEKLLLAADCGDTATVSQLLASGINPDAHAAGGAPPLLMAVRNGHIAIVELLLKHGAHPNPDGCRYYTALTHVIHRSLRQNLCDTGEPASRMLDLLLAAGARYNLIDAVLANDLDLVRDFLDEGSDPDAGKNSYNGPLLMEAARHGHVEMVDLLLDYGADIEATDDLNQTSLEAAQERGQLEVVSRLIDRGAKRGKRPKNRNS